MRSMRLRCLQSARSCSIFARRFDRPAYKSLDLGKVMPRKPCLPPRSLREVLVYPLPASTYDETAYGAALKRVGLDSFEALLDTSKRWDRDLNEDEQQPLAFARTLRTPASYTSARATSTITCSARCCICEGTRSGAAGGCQGSLNRLIVHARPAFCTLAVTSAKSRTAITANRRQRRASRQSAPKFWTPIPPTTGSNLGSEPISMQAWCTAGRELFDFASHSRSDRRL